MLGEDDDDDDDGDGNDDVANDDGGGGKVDSDNTGVLFAAAADAVNSPVACTLLPPTAPALIPALAVDAAAMVGKALDAVACGTCTLSTSAF